MPKVILSKERQLQRDQDNMIVEIMLKYRNRMGITNWNDVSMMCGFRATETFRSRRKDPGKFTRDEMRRIIKALKIPDEEIRPYL